MREVKNRTSYDRRLKPQVERILSYVQPLQACKPFVWLEHAGAFMIRRSGSSASRDHGGSDGQNDVLSKDAVAKFSGEPGAYKEWKRRIYAWSGGTNVPVGKRGRRIIQALSGEAWAATESFVTEGQLLSQVNMGWFRWLRLSMKHLMQ